MRTKILLTMALLVACPVLFAQEKSKIKFGKITAEDFSQKLYPLDTSASAVVIADIGSTEFIANSKGGFSLEFKYLRRAHILNKNGYDVANVEVYLYSNGDAEEELKSVKAVTYNLENGSVTQTKLDVKNSIYREKIDKKRVIKKFTLPNVKEGSIIEYEYVLHSDFDFNLQPWDFQGRYPRLWSEYKVSIPEFYRYVTLSQGYVPFHVKDQKDRMETFSVADYNTAGAADRFTFSAAVTDFRWVMKDVPAIKTESFTSTINNHLARIRFQLAELRKPYVPKNVMGTWTQACDDLLKREDFGGTFTRENVWLNDVMKEAVNGSSNELEKARSIYTYVRDQISCTGRGGIMIEKNLKNVLNERNGSEAEINLLLVAMMRKAGYQADPVLLSTKSHGYTYPMYPIMQQFNYLITRVWVNGQYYYLDASKPRMGFGKLDEEVYNGHARVVNESATPVTFLSDSLMEKSYTSVRMITNEKGQFTGRVQHNPGFYESYHLRNQIQEKGKDQFFKDMKKEFSSEVELKDPSVDMLDKFEEPIKLQIDFDMNQEQEELIYIHAVLYDAWGENPFKSAERFYPVEMPYAMDQVYDLNMEVPAGYEIDELPKQIKVKLNEQEDGVFEFRLTQSGESIALRSRLRLKRAFYHPEEYEMLREFFNLVVKKHNEQIVLKKKK